MRNPFIYPVMVVLFLSFSLVIAGCSALPRLPFSSSVPEEMVAIRGGWFWMGSNESDGKIGFEIGIDELPKQKVYLRGFAMDRHEVTEKEYYEFILARGIKKYPGYWEEAGKADRIPEGFENYPVSDVDWFDAMEYCKWVGKRLPTEAEWEKAARGPDGRRWPWGDEFVAGRANTQESSQDWESPSGQKNEYGWKAPIGSHPEDVSPYGVYGMAGNVREWTSSSYQSYPGNTVRPIQEADRFKMLRGGSYMTQAVFSRTAVRVAVLPTMGPSEEDGWHSDYTYGFRCAL